MAKGDFLTPPPSVGTVGSPSPIPQTVPSPDHMYSKQEQMDLNCESMINFDTENADDYAPIESNLISDQLDINDFVDENIVNLFPELM